MSRIYDQLNTFKIQDIKSTDIQAISNRVNVMEINEKEMQTFNLINKTAGFNDGLPQKRTQFVAVGSAITDSNKNIIYKALIDEVWKLESMHFEVTGGSGSLVYRFGIIDTNDTDNYVYSASSAVAASVLVFDNENSSMPVISNEKAFFSELTGSFTNYKVYYSLVKIR